MLKSHKNALLETIKDFGLDPASFDIVDRIVQDEGEKNVAALRYKGTDLYFMVRVAPHSHDLFDCCWSLFAPKYPVSIWKPERSYQDIRGVQYALNEWLANVVHRFNEENDAPDYWDEVGKQVAEFVPQPDAAGGADHYTEPEKVLLRKATEQIRGQLKEALKPTEDQLAAINQRLDYMSAALDRLNKTDWKSIVVSTFFGIITTMSVDKATGAAVFAIFRNALSAVPRLFLG